MTINIISTILYAGRILAIVEVNADKIYRTGFYRSSGTNVQSDGDWFPFAGIAGPGAIKRTYNHTGWIIKDYFYTSDGIIKTIPTDIKNEDHSNPEKRLRCFGKTAFDIPETARLIKEEYIKGPQLHTANFKKPIEPEDAEFINAWLIKGLKVVYEPMDAEIERKETQERELAAQLASIF